MLRRILVRYPSRCHSLRKYMGILSLSSSNWIKTTKVVQILFSSSFLKSQGVQSSILRSFYDDGFFGNWTYIDNSYICMFSFYFTFYRSHFTAYRKSWTLNTWALRLWMLGLWTHGRSDPGNLDAWNLDAWNLNAWSQKILPFLVTSIPFLLLCDAEF